MKLAAICVFVRNEERGIQEWIAYHACLGFDTVIVYDNGSDDRTAALAQAMAGRVDVVVVDFSAATGARAQAECYIDCCQRFKDTHQWIAFLDSDEFLAPPPGKRVQDLLAGKFFASAVAFNWACFGANGHVQMPEELTISAFTRRSDETFMPNVHTKVMVRPGTVKEILNPHYFEVDGPMVRPDGRPVDWIGQGHTGSVVFGDWKVNHYFIRSRAHWDQKLARRYRDTTERSADMFEVYDRNDVEDRSADALRAEVLRLLAPRRRPLWERLRGLWPVVRRRSFDAEA